MRVVVDHGTGLVAEFLDCRQRHDIEAYVRPLEVPWQAAQTERHEGIQKHMLMYMLDGPQDLVTDPSTLQELLDDAALAAKNCLMRRGGRSPKQRVFGVDRRLPGNRLQDDGDHRPLASLSPSEAGSEEAARAERVRQVAQRAALASTVSSSLRHARPRQRTPNEVNYRPGQRCYSWRKQGKKQPRRAVWLAYRQELIKTAPEQVRSMNEEEGLEFTMVPKKLQDQKDVIDWGPAHGYYDLTGEERPLMDSDDEELPGVEPATETAPEEDLMDQPLWEDLEENQEDMDLFWDGAAEPGEAPPQARVPKQQR